LNPDLSRLQSYPFQKLSALLDGATPNASLPRIDLYIGEPRHPTPLFIRDALTTHLDGLAGYPLTAGQPELREAIAGWVRLRHGVSLDPESQIVPVNGSREALFAFAQAIVDRSRPDPVVICPNPFYQIYEGAALLSGATPFYLNCVPENNYAARADTVPADILGRTQLIYVCSPGNPTGAVMNLADWKALFELADRHGFIIASDECYSEIYFDEAKPPLGALAAAQQLGRGCERLVIFSSLSKRSNVPGMRSGFVAGDAAIIKPYLLYRTYHGCAMSGSVQAASLAAWRDERHVVENRKLYVEKFRIAIDTLKAAIDLPYPDAAFYLWIPTPIDDAEFTRRLYIAQNMTVLPGSFLGRQSMGVNPGTNRVRVALVSNVDECRESARRLRDFIKTL
jgi:N-succinyldiaminopimelate aminotransferase